jgi:RNA polymerase sigma-70 factor (ECF subfamily)
MIASILAGETHLYHELIRPYERSVYMMALSYMKNEADAEDVAQEAFLKAFHHLATFRSEAKFSTWLVGIALNEARSRLRHAGAMRMESIDETSEEGGHISPTILRDWREVLPKLWSARRFERSCRRRLQASPTSIVRCFYCAMWRS